VHLSPEAEAYFAKKRCKVLFQPTPAAISPLRKNGVEAAAEHHPSFKRLA
jgi:hypothetical protein